MTETAANLRAVETVPEYTTAEEDKALGNETRKGKDSVRFRMDGELFTLNRPKMSLALTMLHMAAPEDARTITDLGSDLIQLVSQTIAYVQTEPPDADGNLRGQARILQRLGDPKDALDIVHLFRPFQNLIEQVFENPTSSRRASGSKRSRTSPASGARSRGARAKTSTT